MKKILILLMVLYILKRSIQKKRPLPTLDTDIVISPGGYKGIYSLGICHYIKNHFNVTHKKFTGFSSGSFNSLFMTLTPEKDNEMVRMLVTMKHVKIDTLLQNIVSDINHKYKDDDFDLSRVQVGITTSQGLQYYNHFLSLEEATYCCKCSSFIPFLTSKNLLLVYKNKLTLDGGLCYKRVKREKKKETLFIQSSMFGRFSSNFCEGFRKPKCSYYQLYLYGYHDARKNHEFLKQYFQDIQEES